MTGNHIACLKHAGFRHTFVTLANISNECMHQNNQEPWSCFVQTTLTCNLCRKDGPFAISVAAGAAAGAAAASGAGAASEAADADADAIGATLRAAGAAILRCSS